MPTQHPLLLSLFNENSRSFLKQKNLLEVQTPLLNQSVCLEPNLDPLIVYSKIEERNYLLPTSPEFGLKKLLNFLPARYDGLFEIAHAFRDERLSDEHLHEFTMLEFYLRNTEYLDLIDFVANYLHAQNLFMKQDNYSSSKIFIHKISFQEMMGEFLKVGFPGIAIDYNESEIQIDYIILIELIDLLKKKKIITEQLYQQLKQIQKEPIAVKVLLLTDLFSLVYDASIIQSPIFQDRIVAIYDFPIISRGMAKIKKNLAQRVEIIFNRTEIANGYQEIDDGQELILLWEFNNQLRKSMNKPEFTLDLELIEASASLNGFAGMAIGIERLISCLSRSII